MAAGETLRRRQRRQAMANFVGTVTLAVPFALAVAAADLSPSDGAVPPRPQPISLDFQPPTNKFMVRHIPDEPLPPRPRNAASMLKTAAPPSPPPSQPAPPGKH